MSEETMLLLEEWQDRMERDRARHDYVMGRRGDPPGPGPHRRREPSVAWLEAERKRRQEEWRQRRLEDAEMYRGLARDARRHNDEAMAQMWDRTADEYERLAGKGDGDE